MGVSAGTAEERTRALVLRVVDYGESDRVVTLLTETFGKTAAFARGARRSKRRFAAGALEAGAEVDAAIGRRPGRGMEPLLRAELLRPAAGLARDLAALARAHYALDLLHAAVPEHQADAALFALANEFVARCASGASAPAELPAFELALLRALGWSPAWTECAECGRPWAGKSDVWFYADRGGLLCPTHAPGDRRGAVRLRADTAQAMATVVPLEGDAMACARACLDLVWRAHLGRELKSVSMLRQLA
jgi:DNA repair protein RecO (recombination protein O)